MPFYIRPALPADAAAIAHIHVQSWKTTYPGIVPQHCLDSLSEDGRRQRWQQMLESADHPTLVAESSSTVFGFVDGGPIRTPIGTYDGELYAIYLLQTQQRLGAGRALVQQLAQSLHLQGFQSMIVWALEANPAVRFYQRLGAIPVTRQAIEIGGATLAEVALGWPDLQLLASNPSELD